jgi:pimeloyl-ACP methyl ester carboxylesterase
MGLNLLFEPSEPLVDLIFVHGLRGGSRKTWSKTNDPYHYWPTAWLPRDPEFKNVRIHSFGYNSDWGETKQSFLNIHDFGKSLLLAIHDSPHVRAPGDTSLILVGHSMGGLVSKKAYVLARQDSAFQALAQRFYGIVFLATPHRGSDACYDTSQSGIRGDRVTIEYWISQHHLRVSNLRCYLMASDIPFTEVRGKFKSSRAAFRTQEREVGVLTFVQHLLPEMRRSKDYTPIQVYFASARIL